MTHSSHYCESNCWIMIPNSDKIKHELQNLLKTKNQRFKDSFYKRLDYFEFLSQKFSDNLYYIKLGNRKRLILKVDSELKKILLLDVVDSSYLNKKKRRNQIYQKNDSGIITA